MKIATKDDVKKLAASIENLAKEIQLGIDQGTNVLTTANELVRNNMVLVFALGEVSGTGAKTAKVVQPRYLNYHKKRDPATGRFLSK
jgi:hypothetical protein